MRASFRHAIVGVVAVLIGTAAQGQSTRNLIDFEDQAIGTPIFNQYPGVIFAGGDRAGNPVQIVEPALGTISGTRALRLQTSSCEFNCALLAMQFTEGQHRVMMSTGLGRVSTSGILAAVLRGYSDVNRTTLVAQSALLILGSMATTVDNPIEVSSSNGSIRSVALSITTADNPLIPLGDDFPVVIDNLEYDRPLAVAPPDNTPPAITITNPTSGETLQSSLPGVVSINVEANIIETALRSVTIAVNGGPTFAASYFATASGNYSVFTTINASDGLVGGANKITLTATDFNNNTGIKSTQFTFVIPPPPPPSTVDIVPSGVEISQGIDEGPFPILFPGTSAGRRFTYPGSGNLRLVQGKQVLVRVYAEAVRSTSAVRGVPATMFVSKADCVSDCLLPNNGLLLSMSNSTTPNLGGATVPIAGTSAADPSNRVGDLGSSWNFLMPASWTYQDLDLFITLNSGNYYPLPDVRQVPECESVIVGDCRDNNDLQIHLSFTPVKSVTLDPVFINFKGTFQGEFVDTITTDADATAAWKTVNLFYPMNVALGPARSFTVSPDLDENDLLDDVQDHFGCGDWWVACGFDRTHFIVGLVPDDKNYPALKHSGLSNRGNNTFWAQRSRTDSTAHEMGHAIGFKHASCDHGEGSSFLGIFGGTNCDDDYPIAHGGIGGYGFNFDAWDPDHFIPSNVPGPGPVILPGITDTSHMHVHDFMSYGHPNWVSTYMWDITTDDSYAGSVDYRDCTELGIPIPFSSCGVDHSRPSAENVTSQSPSTQETHAQPSRPSLQTSPAILVSGHIKADGTATLGPTYPGVLSVASPEPESSPFSIAVLDSKGNTIALRDVTPKLRQNHSGDVSGDFTAMVVIPPGQNPATIQLFHDGTVIASLVGQQGSRPIVAITSPMAGEHWSPAETRRISWDTSGTTAQVRAQVEYSADGGITSIPLGKNIDTNFLDVDVNELSGSNNAQVTVRVSDGVNGAFATSAPFVVDPKPPHVAIVQPVNGTRLISGVPVSLIGVASDLQESLPDNALVWISDVDGTLGTGRQLSTELTPGRHLITLSAKNSLELGASTSVVVRVTDLSDVNGDGVVNCSDITIIKASLGKRSGQQGFDPRADVNKDGVVDILDLSFVARKVPASTSCPLVSGFPDAIRLSTYSNPSTVGRPVRLVAIVVPGPGLPEPPLASTPTGTVTFYDLLTPLGTVALDASAVATLNVNFTTTGEHFITAKYSGDATFVPSSDTVTQSVQ